MLQKTDFLKQYGQAVAYLPPRLRGIATQLEDDIKRKAEEFRLRNGQFLAISCATEEIELPTESKIRHEELASVIEIATGGSVHSAVDSIRNGFITVPGGHRIGICGTGVVKNHELSYIKNISSISIRIAKEMIGAADEVLNHIVRDRGLNNTLIISPPGCGKTTMLRDIIRNLASLPGRHYKVSVVDERCELAAKYNGVAQFDLGKRTDILDGVEKAKAIMLLVRSMTPHVIAVDEITAEEDILAVEHACNCGVALIATAHGESLEKIAERPLYRRLLAQGIFSLAIELRKEKNAFCYKSVPIV